MYEFMNLVYRNWADKVGERDVYFGEATELLEKLDDVLSADIQNDIYNAIVETSLEMERRAFIAGFTHAVKCIDAGKVEIGGADNA